MRKAFVFLILLLPLLSFADGNWLILRDYEGVSLDSIYVSGTVEIPTRWFSLRGRVFIRSGSSESFLVTLDSPTHCSYADQSGWAHSAATAIRTLGTTWADSCDTAVYARVAGRVDSARVAGFSWDVADTVSVRYANVSDTARVYSRFALAADTARVFARYSLSSDTARVFALYADSSRISVFSWFADSSFRADTSWWSFRSLYSDTSAFSVFTNSAIFSDTAIFCWDVSDTVSVRYAVASDTARAYSRYSLASDTARVFARFADSSRITSFSDSARVSDFADSARIAFTVSDIPAGDADYIQNQSLWAQPASFWISGSGRIDDSLLVNGNALVTGKLTVNGGIDPVYLALTPQVSDPASSIGQKIWVDALNRLIYTQTVGNNLVIVATPDGRVGRADSSIYADTAFYVLFADSSRVSGFSFTADRSFMSDTSWWSRHSRTSDTAVFAVSTNNVDSCRVSGFSWDVADTVSVRYANASDTARVYSRYALASDTARVFARFADSSRIADFADSARVSYSADSSRIASTVSDVPAGDADYIQNQSTSAQSANFWISGVGRIDDSLIVDGNARVTGKLTVTGGIDPTYLALTPQVSDPAPTLGQKFWVNSGTNRVEYSQAPGNNLIVIATSTGQVTASELGTNSVSSAHIQDGTIVDSDISSSASISASKLQSTVIVEGENVSLLNNDVGYLTSAIISVNAQTGPSLTLNDGGGLTVASAGNVITYSVGAGNGIAVAADAISVKAGLGISVISTNVDVLVDNVTVGINGSNQVYILNGGVNTNQIANGAVTSAKILDGTITTADLNAPSFSNWDQNSTDDITNGTPASGDLSGTYPNPSVNDDSHNHTAATLPASLSYLGSSVGTSEIEDDAVDASKLKDDDDYVVRNITAGQRLMAGYAVNFPVYSGANSTPTGLPFTEQEGDMIIWDDNSGGHDYKICVYVGGSWSCIDLP